MSFISDIFAGGIAGILDPITKITGQIANAKIELARAQNDEKRIAAEERINSLNARRDVLIAESASQTNTLIRAGFALPFMFYNAKLIFYDKMLGWGTTEELSDRLWQIELACLSFYFLYEFTAMIKGKRR